MLIRLYEERGDLADALKVAEIAAGYDQCEDAYERLLWKTGAKENDEYWLYWPWLIGRALITGAPATCDRTLLFAAGFSVVFRGRGHHRQQRRRRPGRPRGWAVSDLGRRHHRARADVHGRLRPVHCCRADLPPGVASQIHSVCGDSLGRERARRRYRAATASPLCATRPRQDRAP